MRPADTQLLEAAGPPAGVVYGAGQVQLSGFGPLEDRVLYCVTRIVGTAGAYQRAALLGENSAVGGMRLQTASSGGTGMGSRVDTLNGETNANPMPFTPSRIVGRTLIMFVQTEEGMTVARAGSDGKEGTEPITPGDGMEQSPLLIASSNGDNDTLTAVAYRGSHTPEQRLRVMGWLATRFSLSLSRSGSRPRRADFARAA